MQSAPLRHWLDAQVRPLLAPRILPVTAEIALRCAQLSVPDPRPFRDGLIAATAWAHGLTVVTRSEADFPGTGVALFNLWHGHPRRCGAAAPEERDQPASAARRAGSWYRSSAMPVPNCLTETSASGGLVSRRGNRGLPLPSVTEPT